MRYILDKIIERNEKGQIIYDRDNYGNERWQEYDEYGNVIHYKRSNGYEWWNKFDKDGNLIYLKNGQDEEFWFDKNSNIAYTHPHKKKRKAKKVGN